MKGRGGKTEDRKHESFGRRAGMSQLIADGEEGWKCRISGWKRENNRGSRGRTYRQ